MVPETSSTQVCNNYRAPHQSVSTGGARAKSMEDSDHTAHSQSTLSACSSRLPTYLYSPSPLSPCGERSSEKILVPYHHQATNLADSCRSIRLSAHRIHHCSADN